ncbi:MAG: YbbC/YhhH family protein [Candidatus Zixiibacteriota bacterium]
MRQYRFDKGRIFVIFAVLALVSVIACLQTSCSSEEVATYGPKDGIVPDSLTAVRIAEAIWSARYGRVILDRRPFKAQLKQDDVWFVQGTLREGYLGGVPVAEIRKEDGCVLRIGHGL